MGNIDDKRHRTRSQRVEDRLWGTFREAIWDEGFTQARRGWLIGFMVSKDKLGVPDDRLCLLELTVVN